MSRGEVKKVNFFEKKFLKFPFDFFTDIKKKGQATIFIIAAIVIVGIVLLIFLLRSESVATSNIPTSLEPAYLSFLTCLEDDLNSGIDLVETQGGYIDLPQFEKGSTYMPFSSQFNFLGVVIPYWYYVSGNNVEKTQVPTINSIQSELAGFIEEKISDCDLSNYVNQGYEIKRGEPRAKVIVKNSQVEVDLDMDLDLNKFYENAIVRNHNLVVKSNLGNLYNSAFKVYEKEQKDLFLENYSIDILNAYAPVNGVELTCSPKYWNADEIFNDLEEAIEQNTISINSVGEDYFNLDFEGAEVKFINSKTWPRSFDVVPSDGPILISNPIGNQKGLGILGFCYVPYHFVYNVNYPVLVQVSEGDEIFQFPLAVVVKGNQPRKAVDQIGFSQKIDNFCEYRNTEIDLRVVDSNGKGIGADADISYECSDTSCYIGEAVNGELSADFPQCVNGVIIARSPGYKDSKFIFSTLSEGNAEIVMNKIYPVEINLKVDNKNYVGSEAIISFSSNDFSRTIVYPMQKSIELTEGTYEVQVSIFENSSLNLGASTQKNCLNVPRGGLGGLIGLTEEQCFDVQIPEQIISNVLAGGGKQDYSIFEYELYGSKSVDINIGSLPIPSSLEQLQTNYILYDGKGVDLTFR